MNQRIVDLAVRVVEGGLLNRYCAPEAEELKDLVAQRRKNQRYEIDIQNQLAEKQEANLNRLARLVADDMFIPSNTQPVRAKIYPERAERLTCNLAQYQALKAQMEGTNGPKD